MFTVTTAASDLNLLTEAELRAAVNRPTGDADKITTLGNRVSSAIVRACRVPASGATPATLRSEVLSETFRLKSSQDKLILSRKPVTAVATVVEDGTTLTVTTDYETDSAAGVLIRLSDDNEICWPGVKIVVAYTAGWGTVPDDLKLAAVKLAGVLWSEGDRIDPNLKAIDIPGVMSREYWVAPSDDTLMPREVLDLLAPYIHHRVA